MRVLVTGGAGYIGSHTCVELLGADHSVAVLDDLSNASERALARVGEITGHQVELFVGSVLDRPFVDGVFAAKTFDAVIHFAGLKSINESLSNPLEYFQTNVTGTLNLLSAMKRASVKNLVFSSTAAVYGEPQILPISEKSRTVPTNPYGESKLMVERLLSILHNRDPDWRVAVLRYFNPVGAHPSGLIGEDPRNTPSNLLPICIDAAIGARNVLPIFGVDYPTPDGTGVRDFIHVMDLASGHLHALSYLMDRSSGIFSTFNLGTGKGVSVRQMIDALEEASQVKLPVRLFPRRDGDVAACYADVSSAREVLGWEAQRGVDEMCRDAWRWRIMNPSGYEKRRPL